MKNVNLKEKEGRLGARITSQETLRRVRGKQQEGVIYGAVRKTNNATKRRDLPKQERKDEWGSHGVSITLQKGRKARTTLSEIQRTGRKER